MQHLPAWLRLGALTLLTGLAAIACARQVPQPSQGLTQPTKPPPVYVQHRQTQETVELDQLPPIPGCQQIGVEVTSQGITAKCFDTVPGWQD